MASQARLTLGQPRMWPRAVPPRNRGCIEPAVWTLRTESEMKRRSLGDLEVSAIGLGCMSMSPIYGEPSEAEAIATIHEAIERGVDLIDTSDAYGFGANEELIGRALRNRRDKVVLA